MVTHDAAAAAIADRVLFLADGMIVRDSPAPTCARVVVRDARSWPRVSRVALKGLLCRKAARC